MRFIGNNQETGQRLVFTATTAMSRNYKIRNQDKLYFVAFTVIWWLDVFIGKEYRDIYSAEAVKFSHLGTTFTAVR